MAANTKFVVAVCFLLMANHAVSGEKILKRVIKSTPTANSLARVKSVTITADGKTLTSSNDSAFGARGVRQASAEITNAKAVFTPSTTSTTTSTTGAPNRESEAVSLVTAKNSVFVEDKKVNNSVATTSPSANQVAASASTAAWSTPTWSTERPSISSKLVASPIDEDSMSVASSQHHHQATSHESSFSSSDFLRRSESYTEGATKGNVARVKAVEQTNWFYPRQLRAQTSGVKGATRYDVKTIVAPTTTTTTPRPEPIIQQQDYYVSEQIVEAAPPGMAEPFAFQFKTNDQSGNGQYRSEESDKDGTVRGSYGYTDAAGIYRHVEYVADANGFRATIKSNEPGLTEAMPASIHMTHSNPSRNLGEVPENRASVEPTWQSAPSGNLANFESAHRPERLRSPRF